MATVQLSTYNWTPGADGTHFAWSIGEEMQVRSPSGKAPLRVRLESGLKTHDQHNGGYVFECTALEDRPEADIWAGERYALSAAQFEPIPAKQAEIAAGRVLLALP